MNWRPTDSAGIFARRFDPPISTPMKAKLGPLAENIAEATAACLVTMVQGNLLALGVGHWIIASRTGLFAGLVASAALMLAGAERRWLVSTTLGVATAVVDFFVHPGMFGPVFAEAAVTGLAAAVLSFGAGTLWNALGSSAAKDA